jgi:hypothetical protein
MRCLAGAAVLIAVFLGPITLSGQGLRLCEWLVRGYIAAGVDKTKHGLCRVHFVL